MTRAIRRSLWAHHALRRVILGAIALGVSCLAAPSVMCAQEMEVPVRIQIPLFLKVLSFDRHLEARTSVELVVGIAYQRGYRASEIAREEAARSLGNVSDGVAGRRVRVVAIDLDRESLAEALVRCAASVLYVAPLRAVDISEIASIASDADVTTLTGVPRYVRLGIAVGVRLQGDRPRLLINVDAARDQGANFSAELLKLVQVRP